MKATAGQRVRFDIPLSVARVCGYLTRGGILCHLFARKGSGVSVARIHGYLTRGGIRLSDARVLIGTNRVQGFVVI